MTQAEKIRLVRTKEKHDHDWSFNEKISCAEITHSLPFFKTRSGKYVHVVRSGNINYFDRKLENICITFWCGASGFIGEKGKLLSDNGDNPFCAICMGKAIGANVFDDQLINGKPVLYQLRNNVRRKTSAGSNQGNRRTNENMV